jgi:hypothetical protein
MNSLPTDLRRQIASFVPVDKTAVKNAKKGLDAAKSAAFWERQNDKREAAATAVRTAQTVYDDVYVNSSQAAFDWLWEDTRPADVQVQPSQDFGVSPFG